MPRPGEYDDYGKGWAAGMEAAGETAHALETEVARLEQENEQLRAWCYMFSQTNYFRGLEPDVRKELLKLLDDH